MRSLLTEASAKLAAFAQPNNAAYKALLVELIAQGVETLEGAAVTVRCRQVDLGAVQDAAGKAKAKLGGKAAGVSVDSSSFLAPPPNASSDELAFRSASDRLMGDLGTSGDAPFGGEVPIDSQARARGLAMGVGLSVRACMRGAGEEASAAGCLVGGGLMMPPRPHALAGILVA